VQRTNVQSTGAGIGGITDHYGRISESCESVPGCLEGIAGRIHCLIRIFNVDSFSDEEGSGVFVVDSELTTPGESRKSWGGCR
jgi:hypothetical protein